MQTDPLAKYLKEINVPLDLNIVENGFQNQTDVKNAKKQLNVCHVEYYVHQVSY